MKVLLINGSPNEKGSTFTALSRIEEQLNKEGIETELLHVGKGPVRGCIACKYCKNTNQGRCVFDDDLVNKAIEKAQQADGIVLGSPVYYSGIAGTMKSFLDRVFYASNGRLSYKVGCAAVSMRRSGGTSTFDQLNKYFTISHMPVASSQYWNNVHGNLPEETLQDLEGMQTMELLGKNMAWLLKCIELGKQNGIVPEKAEKINTNFIR